MEPEDAIAEAAAIAFAMIRFEEGAAHLSPGSVPPQEPRLGVDYYLFGFTRAAVNRAAVVEYLCGLESPALLAQTTTRGIVMLTLVSSLSGDWRQWAEFALAHNRAGLARFIETLDIADDARVLLEFDDERLIFSIKGMRIWSERFALLNGWNMSRLDDDPGAEVRLHLVRSDGQRTY
jgi:hypothetical protein